MKHSELRSIVHNLADSVGSGCSLLLGFYELDVYGEAARSPTGVISIDLLNGVVVEGAASVALKDAAALCPAALQRLCVDAGGSVTELKEARARYWLLNGSRARFTLTIVDTNGRRSSTEYAGIPARRVMMRDDQGRLRPQASRWGTTSR